MTVLTRRGFLTGTLATASAAALPALTGTPAYAAPSTAVGPFSLGVASGDPTQDGVVLWTRLVRDPLAEDGQGGMPNRAVSVQWQVAADERFRRIARNGTVRAEPAHVHSVHVEVDGLKPGREYFYRFRAEGETSPVGRTKTAPAPGTRLDRLAFAFASCQAWYDGYYTAYRHMAADDLDVLFHLGDYIYEYGVGASGGVRGVQLPEQYQREVFTLAEYRNRHALYRSDPDLPAAHAAFPWVVVFDDHEVENNWANQVSQVDSEPDQDPEVFLALRAVAFRAYYEHLPLRRSYMPRGPDMQMYRRLRFGDLATFNVLDTRQYRDDQACGDGRQVGCAERLDPSRSITGAEQETWLLDGLARSGTTWNVIAQQVVMAQLDQDAGPPQAFGMDLWDGYAASRARILTGMVERDVRNPVVLTGDVHRNLAADLKVNFDDPDSATVGVEFAGTSIASGGDGADMDQWGTDVLAANPHVKFHNAQRGYVRCTVTPKTYVADYRVVPHVSESGAPIQTRASFAVQAGEPGLQQTAERVPQGRRSAPGVVVELDYLEDRQR
ncbi:MAG: alkaline phosphatase [Streptosporangiales bacterium]|nr:alkaline phosphatase [Streptosporangiales bacterium]